MGVDFEKLLNNSRKVIRPKVQVCVNLKNRSSSLTLALLSHKQSQRQNNRNARTYRHLLFKNQFLGIRGPQTQHRFHFIFRDTSFYSIIEQIA